MPDENYTAKFRVDVSDLKKGITEANNEIKKATAEFKNATAGMDKWSNSVDGLTAKITQQQKVVDAEKKKLDLLKQQLDRLNKSQQDGERVISQLNSKYQDAVRNYGAISDQAKKYAKQLADAQAAQERNRKAAEQLNIKIINQDTAVKNAAAQVNKYERELNELQNETNQNADALDDATNSVDEFDRSMSNASSGGLNAFGVALGNIIANVVELGISKLGEMATSAMEVGKQFESSMSNVQAISGATADEMQTLEETARKYGSTTQFSASEAADALGYMALAGWDANQSSSALGGVLNLAAASGMELAEASDMVTDYMSAFSMEADKSAYFADLLAYAQSNANTTAAGLGEAFKNSAANMNAAGQDIETTTALLSMMANQGLKGSEAGTALTAMMRDMTAKMKNGKIQIGDTAIAVQDANGNYRDMTEILQEVEAATNGMGDAERAAALSSTFTADSIKGLNLVLNAGVDEAAKFEEELRNSTGTAEEMARIMNDNLEGDLKSMNSAYEELGITLYQSVNSPLRDIVQTISGNVLPALTDLINGTEGAEERVGNAVAELITNVLTKMIDFFPKAIEIGLNLIKSLITGILEALPDVIRTLTETIRVIVTSLGKFLPEIVTKFVELFPEIADALYDAIPILLQAALEFFTSIVNAIPQIIPKILEAMPKVYMSIADALTTGIPILVEGMKTLLGAIVEAVPMIVQQISSELPTIIATLVDLFSSAFPMILDAAIELLMAVIDAIPVLQDALIDQMPALLMAVGSALIAAAPVLLSAAKKVWSTLLKAIPTLLKGLGKIILNTLLAIPKRIFPPVWNAIKGFFGELGGWIYDKVQERIESIKSIFGAIAGWINDNVFQPIMNFFQPVINFFTTAFEIIVQLAQGTWELIKLVWSAVSAWFNENVITPVVEFFTGLWQSIKDTASAAWEGIKSVWSTVSNWFNTKIITPVKTWFSDMWNGLKTKAADAWAGIKSVFSPVADWFKEKFSNAWQKVKDVFSTGGKVFDGIKEGIADTFKTVVNAIIRGINKIIDVPFSKINDILDTIQDVEVLGAKPFDFLTSRLPIPQIPELEQGGILRKGQIGLLEGNGEEAVVPLEKNLNGLKRIANILADEMVQSGQFAPVVGSGDTINNYNFTQNNNSPKSLSRYDIYRQTKNLINMVKVGGV